MGNEITEPQSHANVYLYKSNYTVPKGPSNAATALSNDQEDINGTLMERRESEQTPEGKRMSENLFNLIIGHRPAKKKK